MRFCSWLLALTPDLSYASAAVLAEQLFLKRVSAWAETSKIVSALFSTPFPYLWSPPLIFFLSTGPVPHTAALPPPHGCPHLLLLQVLPALLSGPGGSGAAGARGRCAGLEPSCGLPSREARVVLGTAGGRLWSVKGCTQWAGKPELQGAVSEGIYHPKCVLGHMEIVLV